MPMLLAVIPFWFLPVYVLSESYDVWVIVDADMHVS